MDEKSWKEFQKQIKKSKDCELWTGPGYGEKGYGVFKIGERRLLAHRAAFEHYNGYLPLKNTILQSCGNKRCCASAHLSKNPERSRP